jgi:hypothetical protein
MSMYVHTQLYIVGPSRDDQIVEWPFGGVSSTCVQNYPKRNSSAVFRRTKMREHDLHTLVKLVSQALDGAIVW